MNDPGARKRAAGKAALSVSGGRGGISVQQHLYSDDHEEHYGIGMVKPAEFFDILYIRSNRIL
jgi:hypothetical protein